jgi:hypothetical protein
MESQKDEQKHMSNGNSANNLSKILSSYLPKDVLEEIDINDSSKTNSLSKNSSSDNSMGKSTKSQTNNNNGNNNNSDSNNSGSNNNKGNNSDTSGNSKNDIRLRKKFHSYPKNDTHSIKHALMKHFINENKYQKLKESTFNTINISRINRSFSGRNISLKKNKFIIQKNKNSNKKNNIALKNKNDIDKIGDEHINLNRKSLNNSDKNLSSKWNLSNEKKSKQLKLIYSHPNLNTYKITNNFYGYNNINNSPNPLINHNQNYENNLMMNGFNGKNKNNNIFKIYNINNENVNNDFFNQSQNRIKVQYPINGVNRYNIISNDINVNKNRTNFDFGDFFQNGNKNNGFNHNFNYVNTINNNKINYPVNGNDINLFPRINGVNNFINKDFQNLFYNLNPLNNSNINMNNFRNNNRNNHINNSNNKFNEYFNIANKNNININGNGNFINNFSNINNNINYHKIQNHNKPNINLNSNININLNQNGNDNNFNNKNINQTMNDKNINDNIDYNDAQIDYLFTQLFSLPKEVCILLYIINKKGVDFFINLTKTIKGSKYLQNILQTTPPKDLEVALVTKIICANYKEIMCDYYGNYFLQKFFPFCNHHQRIDILISIKSDFINIANDICGNHSLQCLISLQNTNEEKEIIKLYTQNNLKDLCLGGNSSHVITKIIKFFQESERQYINTFVIENLIELCIDPNGICVIKEFIYNMKSDNYIKLVLSMFEKETRKLTFNQFGNYVVQEVIRFYGYNYCKNIINNLIINLVEFSLSKFSSNVIDFLVQYLSKKQFWEFCNILRIIFLEEKNFKEMIKNKFSIYVIENCLELLIKINENYYINAVRNNLGYSQKNINNENNGEKEDEFSFENFLKLKKQIFQFIENNSAAKEKKKILALIKSNRHKRK